MSWGIIAGNKASSAEQNAANNAQNTQLYMYNQTADREKPYVDAGNTALSQLSAGTAAGGEFNWAIRL